MSGSGVNMRKVTTSAKSIKIVARNTGIGNNIEDNLGSKRQLRNRCIIISPQVNKRRKSFSSSSNEIPKKISSQRGIKSSNYNFSQTSSLLKNSSSPILSFERCESDYDSGLHNENLDYEPEENIRFDLDTSMRENLDELDNLSSVSQHSGTTSSYERTTTITKQGSIIISKTETINSCSSTDGTDDISDGLSHRSHMIPYSRHLDKAEDGRQDLYIYDIYKGNRVLLDSSSSSGYSGNSPVDENEDADEDMRFSEEYDITNEEENKLLESDDDISSIEKENSVSMENSESQLVEPYEPQPKERCNSQSSDQQSIINDKDSVVSQVFQDNEVTMKGINIIIKAANTNFKKSYKKWDIRYTPYPSDRLFLEDVGYVPPVSDRLSISKCDTKSVISSSESVTSLTRFKVTIGCNQERTCQQVQNTTNHPIEFGFKMPLPPIKRPPTRPKKSDACNRSPSSSTSDPSEKNFRDKFILEHSPPEKKSMHKDDDAISLVASTLDPDHFNNDLSESIKEAESYRSRSECKSLINIGESSFNREYVENWINKQVHVHDAVTTNVQPIEKQFHNPVTLSNCGKNGPKLNFKDINPFFTGLCYSYYFQENCIRSNCKMAHTVDGNVFYKKCTEVISNSTEMQNIYNFSLRFHVLFPDIYPTLLKGFVYHKMQQSLVTCIDDFFALKAIVNPSEAIKQIIVALEETGLTFLEAIEKISFNVGFLRHPELADILLDLITQRPKTLGDNWVEVKRICRAKNYIAPKTFEKMISIVLCSTPINNSLGRDMYDVIVKNELTDLSKVNPKLLTPLKTLSLFGICRLNKSKDRNDRSSHEENETANFDFEDSLSGGSSRQSGFCPNDLSQSICSPGTNSSRNSISSDIYVKEQDERRSELFSPLRDNYQYVPQMVNTQVSQSPVNNQQSHSPTLVIINTSVPPPSIPRIIQPTYKLPAFREINLCPERPIFGKCSYKSEFSFEENLHNLLPCSGDQVAMNESDIKELNDIVVNANGAGYLKLLDQYKGPNTLQHFITMSLAHLKNCANRPYQSFINLIESIEMVNGEFKTDPLMKGVFEVIVFNLLFFCDKNCQWNDAKKLIEMFCDWDSLISSKLLQQFSLNKLTPMGRYIFLAKMLANGNAFYKVYEILRSPDLRLLESPDRWPHFYYPIVDINYRNSLLTEFFKKSYRHNVEVCCDLYRNIFQNECIWEFDAYPFFNPMLEYMINHEKISLLRPFYQDIDIFYGKMHKHIFRAFILLFLDSAIVPENKFKLYELASMRGIYVPFTGRESTIMVRTNMTDSELKLILEYYVYNLRRSYQAQQVDHDLQIDIRLPMELTTGPGVFQGRFRSIMEVNYSIKKLLFECFNLNICKQDNNATTVVVSKYELMSILIPF